MITRRQPLQRDHPHDFECSLTQYVVDQPAALTGTEPRNPLPLLGRVGLLREHVGIKEPHGRIQVRQAATMLHQLLLQAAHQPHEFRPFASQRIHNRQLAHQPSPGNTNGQENRLR